MQYPKRMQNSLSQPFNNSTNVEKFIIDQWDIIWEAEVDTRQGSTHLWSTVSLTIKTRKLQYLGHIIWNENWYNLWQCILQGKAKERETLEITWFFVTIKNSARAAVNKVRLVNNSPTFGTDKPMKKKKKKKKTYE
jgi:hypothetical protein